MDKTYVLDGYHPVEGDVQSLFGPGERATAIAIAKLWLERGWKPFLFSKTAAGKFEILLDYLRQFNGERKRLAA